MLVDRVFWWLPVILLAACAEGSRPASARDLSVPPSGALDSATFEEPADLAGVDLALHDLHVGDSATATDLRVADLAQHVDLRVADLAQHVDLRVVDLGQPVDLRVVDLAQPVDLTTPVDVDLGCVALPASGTLEVRDALDTQSPKWARPHALTCPGTSGTANIAYRTHLFCNTGGERAFQVALDGVTEVPSLSLGDPYLVLYASSGIPADPLACLAGDDDGSPLGTGAQISSVTVAAGGRLTVVATAAGSTIYGTYRLRITAK